MIELYCTLKSSPIHGIGVFALTDIPKGTKVLYQYDTIVTHDLDESEFRALPTHVQRSVLDKTVFIEGERFSFLDPHSATDFRSYMNHSDTPNTDGIHALRFIKEGEELTEDYRTMGPVHPLSKLHMMFL